jgi:GPH family glycoside/pentoside/hexuronide:cation symporter
VRRDEGLVGSTIAAYCTPTLGVYFSLVLTMAYIAKYATDVLLIAPTTMGLIFGLSRIWDAITDPVIGYLSDGTKRRMGRRRPWILASGLPIAIFGVALWAPPEALEGGALTAWFAISFGLYMTAITIFAVPHMALGAELSVDAHGRTRLFGFRQAVATLGSALALVLGTTLLTRSEAPRETAFWLFGTIGVLCVGTTLVAAYRLREPPEYQGRGAHNPFRAVRDVLRNPHGRLLVAMYFIEHMGTGATAVLSPYILHYVIGRPDALGFVFAFYTSSTLLAIPLWVALSRAIGKKRAWLVGMGVAIVGYSALFFVTEGRLAWMCGVVCLTGAASSAGNVLGASVQADVVDWDEHATGERKEGSYYSTFTFLQKTSAGVMAMLTGFALSLSGFVPNEAQSEETKLAMRSLIALVPLACFIVGAAIFSRFRLTGEEHARIRAELDAR